MSLPWKTIRVSGSAWSFAQTERLHGWSQSWFDMMLEGGQRWETV